MYQCFRLWLLFHLQKKTHLRSSPKYLNLSNNKLKLLYYPKLRTSKHLLGYSIRLLAFYVQTSPQCGRVYLFVFSFTVQVIPTPILPMWEQGVNNYFLDNPHVLHIHKNILCIILGFQDHTILRYTCVMAWYSIYSAAIIVPGTWHDFGTWVLF